MNDLGKITVYVWANHVPLDEEGLVAVYHEAVVVDRPEINVTLSERLYPNGVGLQNFLVTTWNDANPGARHTVDDFHFTTPPVGWSNPNDV